MKTFTGSFTEATVDSFYLADQLLAFPEIKKNFIKKQCEEQSLTLMMLVFGYGRDITNADLSSDKMFIANNKFQWTIQTRLRESATFTSIPSASQGAGDASITITMEEDWLTAGMVLMVQDPFGGYQNLMLTNNGAAGGGGYQYTAKLVTGDAAATFDVTYITAGSKAGWAYSLDAFCTSTATKTPFKSLDWYENWTTLIKQYDVICKDGIQQVLWVEGEDGTRCFAPMEEYQKFFQFLFSIEYAGWYGVRTYNDNGVCIVTDANGNLVPAGDGIFAQVSAGNIVNWVIADYDNSAEYESFRDLLESTILAWAIENSYTQNTLDLDVYCGLMAYAFLQKVLINFLEQGGKCCFMDYSTMTDVQAGIEVKSYIFAGFRLRLHKCASFDNKGIQTRVAANSTTPLESWKFVVMPDTNCNGEPLIQCYFRGGCGVDSAYTHTVIPGTVNPMNVGGTKSSLGTSKFRGYEIVDESEFVWVVTDPSKIIVFQANNYQNS